MPPNTCLASIYSTVNIKDLGKHQVRLAASYLVKKIHHEDLLMLLCSNTFFSSHVDTSYTKCHETLHHFTKPNLVLTYTLSTNMLQTDGVLGGCWGREGGRVWEAARCSENDQSTI